MHPAYLLLGLSAGALTTLDRLRVPGLVAFVAVGGMLAARSHASWWVPLIVLAGGAAGALLARFAAADRSLPPPTEAARWIVLAAVAALVYLSVPDTEGATALIGLAAAATAVQLVAPRWVRTRRWVVENPAGVVLVAAITISSGSFRWSGWWVAKVAVVAVAAGVIALSPTVQGRRSPASPPARPS